MVRWSQWREAAHSSGMTRHATALRDRLGVTTHKGEAEIVKNRGQTAVRHIDKDRIDKKLFQKTTLRLTLEAGPDRRCMLEGALYTKLRKWTIPLFPGRRPSKPLTGYSA